MASDLIYILIFTIILFSSLGFYCYFKYVFHRCTLEIIKTTDVYQNSKDTLPIYKKITQQCKTCGKLKFSMKTYKKFKNKTIISISNKEESEKLQLVLFSYGIDWRDSGFSLLNYEEGYDIILNKRNDDSYFMLWHRWNDYENTKKISLENFLKEIV